MLPPLSPLLNSAEPLPGLVWAYRSSDSDKASELPPTECICDVGKGWLWLHFNLSDIRAKGLLLSLPGLERANRLLNATDVEPQIHCEAPYIYGAIADLERDVSETREHVGLLHFVMVDRLLITARRGALFAPGATRQLLEAGVMIPSVEALFESLLSQVVKGADQLGDKISQEIDKVEDRIVGGTIRGARPLLGRYRRAAIVLHRHVYGQRALFQKLANDSHPAPAPSSLVATASRLQQECQMLDREIVGIMERTKSLQEEVSAVLAEETNNNLRVMSMLSILFMPPTFVAGLFGMNLKGMLFGEDQPGFWYGTALAMIIKDRQTTLNQRVHSSSL